MWPDVTRRFRCGVPKAALCRALEGRSSRESHGHQELSRVNKVHAAFSPKKSRKKSQRAAELSVEWLL